MKKYLLAMDESTGIILSNTAEGKIVALVNGKPYNCIDYRPVNEGNGRQLRGESQLAIKGMYSTAVARLNEYRMNELPTATTPAPAPAPVPVSAPAPVAIDYTALATAFSSALSPLVSALIPKEEKTAPKKGIIPEGALSIMPRLIECLEDGKIPYLYGPAGTGKSVSAQHLAAYYGLPYYQVSSVTDIYSQVTGFIAANSEYVPTDFYRAWTGGGVLLLDEMDASAQEALVAINNALSSGIASFPEGTVKKHPDCYIIAAGNTIGRGADTQYTGRNALDASTLDRFLFFRVGYERGIEMRITNDNSELVEFAHEYRKALKKCGIEGLFTYRALSAITWAEGKGWSLPEALESALLKGMEADDIRTIYNAMVLENVYTVALLDCVKCAEEEEF